jgi:hypothetical protein
MNWELLKMKLYKIRHKVTDKYSKGGSYVPGNGTGSLWTDEGRSKSWDTIGKLRSHITSHMSDGYRSGTDMSEWEVVEYETRVVEVKPIHLVVKPERLVQLLKT